MKKTISLFLALLLAVSLSITAFAAEGSENIAENNGMASIKVSGVYAAGEEAAKLINVDIAWGAMSFIYTAGDAAWNPDEHSTTTGAGSWSAEKDSNYITVTNHSNAPVTAAFDFNPADNVDVAGSFEDAELALESAVDTDVDNAPTATTYFNITEGSINANTELGAITVTITSGSTAITGSTSMKYQVGETVTIDNEQFLVLEADAQTALLISKNRKNGNLSTLESVKLPTWENYITAKEIGLNIGSSTNVVGDAGGAVIPGSLGSTIQGIRFNGDTPEMVEVQKDDLLLYFYECKSVSNIAE